MSSAFRWVLFLSFVLKVGLALWLADLVPQYDERQFLRHAQQFAVTGELSTSWRAPGYQWFMGLGLWLGGGHPVGIRLLQALLATCTVALVYRVGRREWGERAGFWAGLLVAFYPTQVVFAHLLWAETLYTACIVLAFERLLALDRNGGFGAALAVGVALAAASITRSTGLALLGISVLWLVFRRKGREGLSQAALIALVAGIGVLAWSVPASLRAGCLVVIDLNGPFNLWSGNNSAIPDGVPGLWGVGLPLEAGFDPRVAHPLPDDGWRTELPHRLAASGVTDRFGCDGSAWFRQQAVAEIASDPVRFLQRIPLKLAAFWSPDFFFARHVVRGWYGAIPLSVSTLALGLAWLASCVVLLGGPMALAALRQRPFRSLALCWIGVYVLIHAVTFGVSRMHFPLVPILALAVAGVFLADPVHRDRDATGRFFFQGLPWAVVILSAWVWIAPTVAGLYLAPGPSNAPVARWLGGLRHLPVPGTQYVAWNLAGVEASVGRDAEARRILEEEGVADWPWSRHLHARLSSDPDRGESELRRYVADGDDLFASYLALAQLGLDRGDPASAIEDLRQAQRLRPWDREVARAIAVIEERAAKRPAPAVR